MSPPCTGFGASYAHKFYREPPTMQALIAICLCLFLVCGGQAFYISVLKQERSEQKAALATATAEAEKQARARESEMADNARKAADSYAQNLARARAGADGARSELDSLRNALAAAGPAPANPASAAGTDAAGGPERELLGACAAALQGMAAQADRLESKVLGLQEWARAVTK